MLAVVSQIKVQELLRTTSIGRRKMIELFSVVGYKGNSVPPIDKVMGSMQLIYMDIRMDVASYVEWMQFRTLDLLLCVNECVQPSVNSKHKHSTSTYNMCASHESECLVSEIANFADTRRMAENENRSPQQPPQPHTEYGFILMIQLILGRPLFSVKIGRMAEIATDSGLDRLRSSVNRRGRIWGALSLFASWRAKINALKNAISLLRNGETLPQLFITIVRYIRGVTLRFLCRICEAEIIEPLIPSILANLEHHHLFVRRNAILVVLTTEADQSAKRNAFLMLCTCAQDNQLGLQPMPTIRKIWLESCRESFVQMLAEKQLRETEELKAKAQDLYSQPVQADFFQIDEVESTLLRSYQCRGSFFKGEWGRLEGT
ncbi:coatomer subunit beta-1 [Tanacetum coccineum]